MEAVEFIEVIEVMVIEKHTIGKYTTMEINVMADINQLAYRPFLTRKRPSFSTLKNIESNADCCLSNF